MGNYCETCLTDWRDKEYADRSDGSKPFNTGGSVFENFTPEEAPNEVQTQYVMTLGDKLAGLSFNPNGRQDVQDIKELIAAVIDIVSDREAKPGTLDEVLWISAIQDLVRAQMSAVKAITYEESDTTLRK